MIHQETGSMKMKIAVKEEISKNKVYCDNALEHQSSLMTGFVSDIKKQAKKDEESF